MITVSYKPVKWSKLLNCSSIVLLNKSIKKSNLRYILYIAVRWTQFKCQAPCACITTLYDIDNLALTEANQSEALT